MMTIKFAAKPIVRRIPGVAGQPLVSLLVPCRSTSGMQWPAGTEMTPVSFGFDRSRGVVTYTYTVIGASK